MSAGRSKEGGRRGGEGGNGLETEAESIFNHRKQLGNCVCHWKQSETERILSSGDASEHSFSNLRDSNQTVFCRWKAGGQIQQSQICMMICSNVGGAGRASAAQWLGSDCKCPDHFLLFHSHEGRYTNCASTKTMLQSTKPKPTWERAHLRVSPLHRAWLLGFI